LRSLITTGYVDYVLRSPVTPFAVTLLVSVFLCYVAFVYGCRYAGYAVCSRVALRCWFPVYGRITFVYVVCVYYVCCCCYSLILPLHCSVDCVVVGYHVFVRTFVTLIYVYIALLFVTFTLLLRYTRCSVRFVYVVR